MLRSCVAGVKVTWEPFEQLLLVSIGVNMIGLIYSDPSGPDRPWVHLVNSVCLGLFVVELVIKALGFGLIHRRDSLLRGWANRLDLIIVAASALSLSFDYFEVAGKTGTGSKYIFKK
jgi:hypothetical protein